LGLSAKTMGEEISISSEYLFVDAYTGKYDKLMLQIDKRIYDLKEYEIHEYAGLLGYVVTALELIEKGSKNYTVEGLRLHVLERQKKISDEMFDRLRKIRENKP
jgi:hypothetical protein